MLLTVREGGSRGLSPVKEDAVDRKRETLLTDEQIMEIDKYLEKRLSTYNGEVPRLWANYVVLFEGKCRTRGWDKYDKEVLATWLSGRLLDKALDAWWCWVYEDPKIMKDYDRFKRDFGSRLEGKLGLGVSHGSRHLSRAVSSCYENFTRKTIIFRVRIRLQFIKFWF